MKRALTPITVLILLALACVSPASLGNLPGAATTSVPTPVPSPTPAPVVQPPTPGPAGRCGDGVCAGPETAGLCPADCAAEASDSGEAAEAESQPPATTDDVYLAVEQAAFYQGTPDECWYDEATRASALTDDSGFAVLPRPGDGSATAPLLFNIIVHVEPVDAYNMPPGYERDRDRLTRYAELVAAHSGKLTIQTQRPFITTAQALGDDDVHRSWEALGHEIAIHFHENEYVADEAPAEEWIAALGGLKDEIQGLADNPIRNWSGGNLYPHMWEVAEALGLTVNTNFKNRYTQLIDPLYITVSPWRPAGTETDEQRAAHDPNGPVVYLPAGIYPAHCDKAPAVPRPYTTAALDYITTALIHSLNVARPGYVNVAYTTMHPGDFRGPGDDEAEFARWDEWLTTVIDPLVADGRLQWATASQMAQAFIAWEGNS